MDVQSLQCRRNGGQAGNRTIQNIVSQHAIQTLAIILVARNIDVNSNDAHGLNVGTPVFVGDGTVEPVPCQSAKRRRSTISLAASALLENRRV